VQVYFGFFYQDNGRETSPQLKSLKAFFIK